MDLFVLVLFLFEGVIDLVSSIPEGTTAAAQNGAPENNVSDDGGLHSFFAIRVSLFAGALIVLVVLLVLIVVTLSEAEDFPAMAFSLLSVLSMASRLSFVAMLVMSMSVPSVSDFSYYFLEFRVRQIGIWLKR